MSRFCPLFSSSKGNVSYISCKEGSILIDAGVSYKALLEALEKIGSDIKSIKAVAVTHEHLDHIKCLKTLLSKNEIPLIASKQTAEALISFDKIPSKTKIIDAAQKDIDICGIHINRFATSHDCEGSSGYFCLLPDGKKITVCTDLGVVSDEVRGAIFGSDLILIESNHDITKLKNGPYPPELKLRILSDKGHISNIACATEIKTLFQNGTRRFILGHLSENNNTPMLAKKTSVSSLADLGAVNEQDYILSVASPADNGVTII